MNYPKLTKLSNLVLENAEKAAVARLYRERAERKAAFEDRVVEYNGKEVPAWSVPNLREKEFWDSINRA